MSFTPVLKNLSRSYPQVNPMSFYSEFYIFESLKPQKFTLRGFNIGILPILIVNFPTFLINSNFY